MQSEPSFDFLKQCDAIIAGDSNILLEAALMNVLPMYYDFSLSKLDFYGFVHNKLATYYSMPDELCSALKAIIDNKPSVRLKAKYYCSTIGTHYDGHSSDLASAIIQEFVYGNNINMKLWNRTSTVNLEAYELDVSNGVH